MSKLLKISLILFAMPLFLARADARKLSPHDIVFRLHSRNPRVEITKMHNAGIFDEILVLIGRGKSDWIAIAPDLKKNTDAGYSEDLRIALARALLKNPSAVLMVLNAGSGFDSSTICSIPFIEPTKFFYEHYKRDAKIALAAVTNPALAVKKNGMLE